MRYPAKFQPEPDGGFTVTFRDIPEAITQGDTMEEATAMAADALLTAMDFYFEDRRAVPAPSKARRGEQIVELPASVWAKVLLLNRMVEQQVRPADLARRLGTTPQEASRIMNLRHPTKIDTLSAALSALGQRLELSAV